MASVPTFDPTAYGNFDPTQWSNPYSLYSGGALPWPSSYGGTPTNASGQPIASYQQWLAQQQQPQAPTPAPAPQTPGLTLNSAPQQQTMQVAGPSGSGRGYSNYGNVTSQPTAAPSAYGSIPGIGSMNAQQIAAAIQAQQQPAAPAPAAAPNNWQAALAARANPGFVATPGATVPQAATSYQPSNGVLQQFLANWKPGSSGPGAGFQQAFAQALRGGQ